MKRINIRVYSMDTGKTRLGRLSFSRDMTNEEIVESIYDSEAVLDSMNPFRPDSDRVDVDKLAYDLSVEC